jgi:hypothetical protein
MATYLFNLTDEDRNILDRYKEFGFRTRNAFLSDALKIAAKKESDLHLLADMIKDLSKKVR